MVLALKQGQQRGKRPLRQIGCKVAVAQLRVNAAVHRQWSFDGRAIPASRDAVKTRGGVVMTTKQVARAAAVAAVLPVAATLALWGPAVSGAPVTAAPAGEQTSVARVSGERAYRHVLALSQKIGPHPAGTPQDKESGEYIAAQLTRDGDAVEWQPFTFPYFAVRRQALTVPGGPALHPRAMEYSPSTPEKG